MQLLVVGGLSVVAAMLAARLLVLRLVVLVAAAAGRLIALGVAATLVGARSSQSRGHARGAPSTSRGCGSPARCHVPHVHRLPKVVERLRHELARRGVVSVREVQPREDRIHRELQAALCGEEHADARESSYMDMDMDMDMGHKKVQ